MTFGRAQLEFSKNFLRRVSAVNAAMGQLVQDAELYFYLLSKSRFKFHHICIFNIPLSGISDFFDFVSRPFNLFEFFLNLPYSSHDKIHTLYLQ